MNKNLIKVFACLISIFGAYPHALSAQTKENPPANPNAEPLAQSTNTHVNTAKVPVSKLENNGYFWFGRHQEIVQSQQEINPEYVLIGDSITHIWEGMPTKERGNKKLWEDTWGAYRVINMGFGWDRTQNVLWRLDHGEVEHINPKWIILNIGTNNFSQTARSRANTPEEISQAIVLITEKLHAKSPDSKILVMGVFPRLETPNNPPAAAIEQLNQLNAKALEGKPNVFFLDIREKLLMSDGTVSKEIFSDGTHLSPKGYAIWGQALRDFGIFNNEYHPDAGNRVSR